MKDAEKGKGLGILTLWLSVFFCLCLFSIRESMNADNGKGAWLFGFIQIFFVPFFLPYIFVLLSVYYIIINQKEHSSATSS